MVVHRQLVEPGVCLSDLYDVFLFDIVRDFFVFMFRGWGWGGGKGGGGGGGARVSEFFLQRFQI